VGKKKKLTKTKCCGSMCEKEQRSFPWEVQKEARPAVQNGQNIKGEPRGGGRRHGDRRNFWEGRCRPLRTEKGVSVKKRVN